MLAAIGAGKRVKTALRISEIAVSVPAQKESHVTFMSPVCPHYATFRNPYHPCFDQPTKGHLGISHKFCEGCQLPASESRLGVPVASSAPDEEIPALLAPDARSRSTLMLDTD